MPQFASPFSPFLRQIQSVVVSEAHRVEPQDPGRFAANAVAH